jgi:FKBP-type peptidyl-prolyl cis-trans isomerase SlyD
MEVKVNAQKKPGKIADDVVVQMHYTLTVDEDVVDTSEDGEPIVFIQGHDNIISGLEREIYDMEVGDVKLVNVPFQDAYGEVDEEAIVDVPFDEFPPEIPVETGIGLQVTDDEGNMMDGVILSVGTKSAKVDFNHPLASKDLLFEVTVVDLRSATEEEIEQGHVHIGDFPESQME